MTVCIAAIAAFGDIVSVSDQMLSMHDGSFTAESVALKDAYINEDWRAMFAAEDIGVVPSLLRRIRGHVRWDEDVTVDRAKEIAMESFQAERRESAVAHYLGTYGISLQEFLSNGSILFGEAGSAIIRERIEGHRLNCELMLVGHTGPRDQGHRRGHILHVADPGIVKDYAVNRFWAIGTGSYLALSSLALRGQSDRYSISRTLYNACEAKFLAESAVGVGRETFAAVHRPDRSWSLLSDEQLATLRKEWQRIGKPRDPAKATTLIEQWHKEAKWHAVPPKPANQSSSETTSSSDQT